MSSRVTCRSVEYRVPASTRKVRTLEMSRTIVRRLRGLRRGSPSLPGRANVTCYGTSQPAGHSRRGCLTRMSFVHELPSPRRQPDGLVHPSSEDINYALSAGQAPRRGRPEHRFLPDRTSARNQDAVAVPMAGLGAWLLLREFSIRHSFEGLVNARHSGTDYRGPACAPGRRIPAAGPAPGPGGSPPARFSRPGLPAGTRRRGGFPGTQARGARAAAQPRHAAYRRLDLHSAGGRLRRSHHHVPDDRGRRGRRAHVCALPLRPFPRAVVTP